MLSWEYVKARLLQNLYHLIFAVIGAAIAYGANWLNGQHLGDYSILIAASAGVVIQNLLAILQDGLASVKQPGK